MPVILRYDLLISFMVVDCTYIYIFASRNLGKHAVRPRQNGADDWKWMGHVKGHDVAGGTSLGKLSAQVLKLHSQTSRLMAPRP